MEPIFNNRQIIWLDSVDSTNLFAWRLIKDKQPPEGTIVAALEQTGGRGQMGTRWESQPGANLTFSLILRPSFLHAEKQFYLSRVIALAIHDFVKTHTDNVSIKWPNDTWVHDKKIAGTLIENSLMGASISCSIAGIGLNLNQETFGKDVPNPVSLKLITGKSFEPRDCLIALSNHIENWYGRLQALEYHEIEAEYLSRLYRYMEYAGYRDNNGDFKARITGVEKTGELVLELRSGEIRRYAFKEVEFLWA